MKPGYRKLLWTVTVGYTVQLDARSREETGSRSMLQPKSYPEFVAKALMLDSDPFEAMVDDDNPWMEGFVLVMSVSVLAGIAYAIGSLLTALTLPDPTIAYTALVQGWRQVASATSIPPADVERIISDMWTIATIVTGYAGGWSHLLPILVIPGVAFVWWIFFSIVAFGVGRAFGGGGSLNATFGATALTAAPLVLLVVSIVPFANIGVIPIMVWAGLIGYRAVHVAQEVTWRNAALTTVIVYVVALVLILLVITAFALGYSAGGFR